MTNPAHLCLANIEFDSKASHARVDRFSVSPPVVSPPNLVPAGVAPPPRTGVSGWFPAPF